MCCANMTDEEKFEYDKTETYTTEHYVFHYRKGSLAEEEIQMISETQEKSFSKICSALNVVYPERIHYYLTDSPQTIGRVIWNEDFPCNGIALCGRNKIYAVYTENIKCIGSHEDTHLISSLLNYPESDFVVEGLAMSIDGLWWGLPNETWVSYYRSKYPDLSVKNLFDNGTFAKTGDVIAYPIAGAFSKFLIDTFGMARYLDFYKYDGCEYDEAILSSFGISMLEIEALFWNRMNDVAFDAPVLEKMLKDEGF